MIKNAVTEVIANRRSIRAYKPEQITQEELETVIECGFLAPSGSNGQTWFLSVIQDQAFIKELSEKNAAYTLRQPDLPQRVLDRFNDPDFSISFGAPTVIFIAYPKTGALVDVSLLAENMVIAAASIGLGTCYLGGIMGYLSTDEGLDFVKRMKIPEDYQLAFGLTLGYPAESPEAKPRDREKIVFIK